MRARTQTANEIFAALVADGTLQPQQAETVHEALEPVLSHVEAPARLTVRAAIRRHAAEVAGYVGAVFVGLSAVLFLAQSWDDVGQTVRIMMLAGVALVVGVAGAAVARSRSTQLSAESTDARRRVAGTLLAACAAVTSLTAWAALQQPDGGIAPRHLVLVPLAGLVVAVLGYALAPTALGQLAVLVALLGSLFMTGPLLDLDSLTFLGVAFVLVGAGWFALVHHEVVREATLGYALAGVVAVLGAQMAGMLSGDPDLALRMLSIVLTAAVAAALLIGYATATAWPLLATGVLAASIAAVQMLDEWFGDTLGVPGMLFASGLILLLASIAGLRIGRHARSARRPDPSQAYD